LFICLRPGAGSGLFLSLLSLLLAATASAQDASVDADSRVEVPAQERSERAPELDPAADPALEPAELDAPAGQGAVPAEVPTEGVEEIIVTAEKAGQDLQDEALSTVQFDAADVQAMRIEDLRDISSYTPNLEIKSAFAASNPQLFLRGVGINDLNSNAASSVAVYNDGVYMNSPAGQLAQMYDVSSVEVLRGPQGSLWGRNASAGAILVSSRKPTQELDAYGTVTFGNYNLIELSSGLGGPILPDLLSFRGAFRLAKADGWLKNRCHGNDMCAWPNTDITLDNPTDPNVAEDLNDTDNWAARGLLRLTPDFQEMDWLLNVHGSNNDSLSTQFNHLGARVPQGGIFPCDPSVGAATGLPCRDALGYYDRDDGDLTQGEYSFAGKEELSTLGTSLTGDWILGDFMFHSISGYESNDRTVEVHYDASPNDLIRGIIDDNAWQLSQELWVSWDSPGGGLSTTTGGFFLYEQVEADNLFLQTQNRGSSRLGPPFNRQGFVQDTTTFAIFEHFKWDLSELYTLEGGIRYNWERKDFDITAIAGRGDPNDPGRDVISLSTKESSTWSGFSGDVSLQYRPTDDVMVYAKYARGWKSGAWNGGASSEVSLAVPVEPETVDSFEIGFKTEWFDHLLMLNVTGFYYDYDNLQVFTLERARGAAPVEQLVNANDAEVLGAELELFAAPLDAVLPFAGPQIQANFGWLEATYNDFFETFSKTLPPVRPIIPARRVDIVTDYSGNRLVGSPRFAASGSVEWELPLVGVGARYGWIIPRYDFAFKDEVFFDPAEGRGILQSFSSNVIGQEAYWLHNFRLTYRNPGEHFEVSGWVRNALDERYLVDGFDVSEGFGLVLQVVGMPRTYGATVTFYFGGG
jgi:iron complex outermembrane receptor protein